VLERPDGTAYYVLDDDVLYVFTHPDVSSTLAPPRTARNEASPDEDDTDDSISPSGGISTVTEATIEKDANRNRKKSTEDDGDGALHQNGSEGDQSTHDRSSDSA
ncbi:MAG: hypothetical protein ACI8VE_001613, partial [Natrialbaceae archaeon]